MNSKETASEVATIDLGDGHTAIIDADLFDLISFYQWQAVKYHRCWYARMIPAPGSRHGRPAMHRMIAQTPWRMVCHHRNRNTLDNRKANLLNMTPNQHRLLHQNNTLLIKFAERAGQEKQPSLPRPDI